MKKLIIFFLIISSFVCAFYDDLWILDFTNNINISIGILGLSFATYCFLFTPLGNMITKDDNKNSLVMCIQKLINSLSDDISFIFKCLIILIIINIVININIPLIIDPKGINFGVFKIDSVKTYVCNFIICLFLFLELYSFYDIMMATFTICKNIFFNDNK